MSTVSSREKIQSDPLFGINITSSANASEKAFEIAEISDNLGIDLLSVRIIHTMVHSSIPGL
jgi:hypothetical protein